MSPAAPLATASRHAWWILLLAALLLHGLATSRRIERVEALSNRPTWSVDAPLPDATSPSGFENGQRRLIVPGHHNPSFWWIMEAQQSVHEGRLRLRHIAYDNPPEGRDIPRTAPYRWWLVAVGAIHRAIAGDPLGLAIERGALWADPLLLALLLVGGAIYCARFLGTFAAAGFVIGGMSLFPLSANFQPGAPDPRSLAWVLALGSILPLFVTLRRYARGQSVRRHACVAGVCGGLGFWNDATTQAPVLLAVALGAVAFQFASRRKSETALATGPSGRLKAGADAMGTDEAQSASHQNGSVRSGDHLWRTWAISGAVTTLAASVFEFAPHPFTWVLDAVHPVHALAWWGIGEVLQAIGAWRRAGRTVFTKKAVILLVIAGMAVLTWPTVASMSGTGGMLASDFYALELANHPQGGIASNLHEWLERSDGTGAKWATLLPCALLVIALGRVLLVRDNRESRARLVFLSVAALIVLVLAYNQLRWWNLFDVFVVVILAALFAGVDGAGLSMRLRSIAAALLVVPGLFVGFPRMTHGNPAANLTAQEIQALVARDFAYWVKKRAGPAPVVLYSTPVFAGAAGYYGGFSVIASSDASDETGYLTAARIASASTAQEAAVLLRSRAITHLALPLWDHTLDQLVRTGRNLGEEDALPQDAFSVSLRWWGIPLWMRPMDYLIPAKDGFQGLELRAFAVQPEQPAELALSRLADFFIQRGQLRELVSLRESLDAYPRSVVALGAIATIDLALRDRTRLEASLEKLIPRLSRRSARNLPPDRHISLAVLFSQVRRPELAREQLTACFERLDDATLRTFTPGTMVALLALSRSLEVDFPNDDLRAVAMELVPPSVRASVTGPTDVVKGRARPPGGLGSQP